MNTSDPSITLFEGNAEEYKRLRQRGWGPERFKWMDYTRKDVFHRGATDRMIKLVASLAAKVRDGAELVDLGCGPGLMVSKLRGNFRRIVGLDFCPEMIDLAKASRSSIFPRPDFLPADVETPIAPQVPATVRNFDIATCCFLLDETENIEELFRNCAYLLRPSGALVCGMLDGAQEHRRFGVPIESFTIRPLILRRSKKVDSDNSVDFFRILRTADKIIATAEVAGFKVVSNEMIPPEQMGRPGPALRIIVFNLKPPA